MHEISKKQLVTINLKYSSSAKPLKTLAFAQISAKTLFLAGKPLTLTELSNEFAKLVGIKKVSEELLKQGLMDLENNNKAEIVKGKWALTDNMVKEIENDIDLCSKQIEEILRRHFPKDIKQKALVDWFNEASACFFGYYGDEWVKSVCKNMRGEFSKSKTLEELLNPSIDEHKLNNWRQELIDGFFAFLSSDYYADQQNLMGLGLAMFSARLVTADVGIDPITLAEIEQSILILDTNLLFEISLHGHRMLQSLETLGPALNALNSRLFYLYITREEYYRKLSSKTEEVLNIVDKYPDEIIKEAHDNFIIAARERNCFYKEDYRNFFDYLQVIPEFIPNGPNISIRDDDEISEIAKIAEKDTELKKEIQNHCLKLKSPGYKKPKSKTSLNHDATLLNVAKSIRSEGERCWVLSMDKTLQACDIDRTGPHNWPLVLSLDALIQILALNNAGPDLDASNFAPLLMNIILNKCTPPTSTYTLTDLLWLYEINERVADFKPDKIRQIVELVTKARIEGKTPDDRELQLNVNRMYQGEKLELNQQLEDYRKRAQQAEESEKKERELREKREKQLIEKRTAEIIKGEKIKLIKILLKRTGLAMLATCLLYFISFLIPVHIKYNYLFAVTPFLVSILFWVPKPYKEYKNAIKDANKIAENEIKGDQ